MKTNKLLSSLKIAGYFLCFTFLKINIVYAFKSVSTSTALSKLNNLELIEDCQNKPNLSNHNSRTGNVVMLVVLDNIYWCK
jgi:hypothetical protein